ncbi:hypothetical protein QBC38DRAFT_276116 [Podospora fimiseda]|uniref:C3H1-type domain-containing protein n=1 Tax=Podospora fimiseda TaxID=252190 RepID=A0AAN7H3C4_9PEZI|nr:hypothetical protein QBC38DRAFT_276116 [Podospora fimiseda]
MSTPEEERAMLDRIARLAGQINRHRNQQAGFVPPPPQRPIPHNHHHHRMSTDYTYNRRAQVDSLQDAGYHTGWRRGTHHPYRGSYAGRGRLPVHRNRTLVLNAGSATRSNNPVDGDSGTASDASTSSWVTKNDRHLQLINTSVYEKQSQTRVQAIEETRQQKLAMKNKQERAMLLDHLNRLPTNGGGGYSAANKQTSNGKYTINVQGIKFTVVKNGSKLVKAPGDGNSAKATPKMATIGGVKFYRSKNGNLYRHGIVKAQRQSGAVKKVNIPCNQFSMTGSCAKGPRCRYVHDPHKVAICKDYLLGSCPSGEDCDLSHDPTPERTPTCLHFGRDSCNKNDCKYAHVKVSPGAPVCHAFGRYGYCDKGANCTDRHAFECPDFSNTGVCKVKGCKLPHRERASVLRKATLSASNNSSSGGEDTVMEDLSSDEDGESVDSDDVDSDEVDEFIGQDDDDGGLDFTEQRDFIRF